MTDRLRRLIGKTTKASSTARVVRKRPALGGSRDKKAGTTVPVDNEGDMVLQMLRYSPSGLNTFRSHTYLHVSDLLGKCVRKIALSQKLNIAMPAGLIADSMGLTFAQGTAIHDYVKDKFLKGHPDKLFGRWSCLCGGLVTGPMLKSSVPDTLCDSCGRGPDRYLELEVHNDDIMVVGSPDVTLYLTDYGVYYPVEIKSIAYDEWKEMVRPKPDHVLQVLFYWYLLREDGYPVPSRISILYVSKGYLFKSPFKEFVVAPEAELGRLDDYIEEARALKAARNGGPLPPRTLCSSVSCKDAKECHVAAACFQHT